MDASPWSRSDKRPKVPKGRQRSCPDQPVVPSGLCARFSLFPRTDVRGSCLPSLRDSQESAASKRAAQASVPVGLVSESRQICQTLRPLVYCGSVTIVPRHRTFSGRNSCSVCSKGIQWQWGNGPDTTGRLCSQSVESLVHRVWGHVDEVASALSVLLSLWNNNFRS